MDIRRYIDLAINREIRRVKFNDGITSLFHVFDLIGDKFQKIKANSTHGAVGTMAIDKGLSAAINAKSLCKLYRHPSDKQDVSAFGKGIDSAIGKIVSTVKSILETEKEYDNSNLAVVNTGHSILKLASVALKSKENTVADALAGFKKKK